MSTVADIPHQRWRRAIRAVASAAALAALAFGLFAGQARAAEQIEGTWLYQGGEVLVEATGSGTFKGTVITPTAFSGCTHPAGQVMWQMSGTGTHYDGTHIWYTATCAENPGGAATWDITSTDPTNFQLQFCTQEPGTGGVGPSSICNTLTRSKPPVAPVPPIDQVVTFPKNKRCVSKRKFRIRIHQVSGVEYEKAAISLNGKEVKVLKKSVLGKKRLVATIDLRGLPRGTFKVGITVLTTTGDTIKGSRKYKTCRKGKKPKRSPKL